MHDAKVKKEKPASAGVIQGKGLTSKPESGKKRSSLDSAAKNPGGATVIVARAAELHRGIERDEAEIKGEKKASEREHSSDLGVRWQRLQVSPGEKIQTVAGLKKHSISTARAIHQ